MKLIITSLILISGYSFAATDNGTGEPEESQSNFSYCEYIIFATDNGTGTSATDNGTGDPSTEATDNGTGDPEDLDMIHRSCVLESAS